jgi:hypothetical protein
MKDSLLIATAAGVGLLAGLGIAAVRGDLWRPAAVAVAPVTATPAPAADAAVELQPAAPEPAASATESDGREDAASRPAPSYEEEAAARDRAAAHGARSR